MVAYKNFYETVQEARMRLRNTAVKYRDDFYYVLEIGDHMPDGKFRVYMDEMGHGTVGRDRLGGLPSSNDYSGHDLYYKFDSYLEKNPDKGLVRKYADSRHFNKFRPFPLGNVNIQGAVVYTERTPTRNIHQGLLSEAVMSTVVKTVPPIYDPHKKKRGGVLSFLAGNNQSPLANTHIDFTGPEFYAMLQGSYPSYEEVVYNLRDPSVTNDGCAFHREYSVIRGPVDTLILCYKHSGVGLIDTDESVTIGRDHEFLKEELQELDVFSAVRIKGVKYNA